jgi:hypothetical protein
MTINRDAALNTVYQSVRMAREAVGSLCHVGEMSFEESSHVTFRCLPHGWVIQLSSC